MKLGNEKLTVEDIEKRLAAPKDVEEEMDLLLRLSDMLHRNQPRRALQYARQVVQLATLHHHMENKAHGWRMVGVILFLLNEYKESLSLLQDALCIFERLGDEAMCAKTRHYIASIYVSMGEHNDALALFRLNLATFENLGNGGWIVATRNYIGSVYEQTGEADEAIQCHLQTLEIARSMDRKDYLARSLYHVAVLYGRLGNYERSLEYADQSRVLWKHLGDTRGMGFVLDLMINCYIYLGRYEEADALIPQTEKLLRKLGGAKDLLTDLQICRGRTALGKARDARAMRHFRRAYRMALSVGHKNLMIISLAYMGKTFMYRGQYRSALRLYLRAEKDVAAISDRQTHLELYKELADAYEALGEVNDALRYRTWYIRLREQILGQRQQRVVIELSMLAERKAIEQERELYRQKASYLEQEVARITKELTEAGLHLLQKNEAIRHIARQLQSLAGEDTPAAGPALRPLLQQVKEYGGAEEWTMFEKQFELRYRAYSEKLLHMCPSLSAMERKVCTLLMLNLLSKEIAGILCISPRTVDRHRYNIRKKMQVPADVNLVTFLSLLALD